jgi:hypothetical protein
LSFFLGLWFLRRLGSGVLVVVSVVLEKHLHAVLTSESSFEAIVEFSASLLEESFIEVLDMHRAEAVDVRVTVVLSRDICRNMLVVLT